MRFDMILLAKKWLTFVVSQGKSHSVIPMQFPDSAGDLSFPRFSAFW